MRGRRLEIEWHEEAATLRAAYLRERHPQRRLQLQGLWLLRTGRSLAATATVVGVGVRTLQRWVQWYRAGGLPEVGRHVRGCGTGSGAPCKLTATQQAAVRAAARDGQFGTVWEARDWVESQYQVSYSYWGLRRLLQRLRLRKKVPRPLSAKADLAAQEAWKKGA